VVGYGPFSLCVIHKEGLCSSSGDINRLMMKNRISIYFALFSSKIKLDPTQTKHICIGISLYIYYILCIFNYIEKDFISGGGVKFPG
jgi:hypothetical protein